MTRAHVILTMFVFAAAPVLARSGAVPKPRPASPVLLDLSGIHLFHPPAAPSTAFSAWNTHMAAPPPVSLSKLGAGPLHAEFGLDDNPRANLSGYQLQGVDQLGSTAWQAERGKSAKLMFTWPTDK
jgi:hypothetical protein